MTTPDIIPGSPGHMVRLFLDGIEREKRDQAFPNHPTPAEPPERCIQTEVGPNGVLRSCFPTADVAVPSDVDLGSC